MGLLTTIRRLLNIGAICLPIIASAQVRTTGTVDLVADYGLTSEHDHTLSAHGFTYADAKKKYPAFVEWAESAKFTPPVTKVAWTQAEVLGVYEIVAAEHDAFWKNWGYLREGWNFGDVRSRGSILFPDGAFRVNYPLMIGFGRYIGKGSNCYYVLNAPGATNVGATAGTAIVIDHEKWMGSHWPDRACMVTCVWGGNDGNYYSQGTVVEGFYFNGQWGSKAHDPSFRSFGLGVWDSGEASTVRNCYADGFNSYGFCFPKGTPTYIEACSGFSNGLAGLAILGNNGLSTTTVTDFSGDDNGALILVEAMPGQTSGGTICINGVKSEAGKRTPYRPQVVLKATGALNMVVSGVSADCQNTTCTNAFDIDFQDFPGQVEIHGARLNGYANALTMRAKGQGTTVVSPGNIIPFTLEMNENGVYRNTRAPGTVTPPPVDPPPTGTLKATASDSLSADHKPRFAVDGSASTYWAGGTGQAVGDWFQIDQGSSKPCSGVTFTAGPDGNSWPLTYKVETSLTGNSGSWTQRGTVFTGGETSTATFPRVTARCFRITLTSIRYANGPWWEIGEATLKP